MIIILEGEISRVVEDKINSLSFQKVNRSLLKLINKNNYTSILFKSMQLTTIRSKMKNSLKWLLLEYEGEK